MKTDIPDIRSASLAALAQTFEDWGEKAFRARQVFDWLHAKRAVSFDQMTNLPVGLREKLKESFALKIPEITRKLVSRDGATVKYLLRLADGAQVETVFMRYHHGNSLCISTQVGCKMGCAFCASTKAGFVRNLSPAEMLEQVYTAERDMGEPVSNIVLMGIGEPLDNYANVLVFLKLVSNENGRGLSPRHITLSTCGLVDGIDRLAGEGIPVTLAVSLHAPNDAIRRKTMPVSLRWPMDELLSACGRFAEKTGRRVTFEYALINGVNDRPAHARELAKRLAGTLSHVNLIPVNRIAEEAFSPADRHTMLQFQEILQKSGISATIRRTLGADINAACGQLRREALENDR